MIKATCTNALLRPLGYPHSAQACKWSQQEASGMHATEHLQRLHHYNYHGSTLLLALDRTAR